MKIVQFVENLETGGLERLAVDLAITQKHAGHSSSIYCLFGLGPLAKDAENAGIPTVSFQKTGSFSPKTILQLARQLRKDKVDVVHTHNPGIHHYGALAAKLAGVKVVLNTRHGPATSLGLPYQEKYFRWVLPWTTAVVFVSRDSMEYLVSKGKLPQEKAHVIINGIYLAKYLNHPANPGSVRPRIRFGTVGRMVPVKGHSILLEAFHQVARELPEAELRIVGGGSLRSKLEEQRKALGLEARVALEDLRTDVEQVLTELDVFVFSSLSEGLPLVILEAMAAGLPIVSTRVGGVPEVAPENDVAWYCEPGNPEALAKVMIEAANSMDLRERGERARALAVSRYSIESMNQQYMEIIHSALNQDRI